MTPKTQIKILVNQNNRHSDQSDTEQNCLPGEIMLIAQWLDA